VKVAGTNFDPGIGYSNQRTLQVLIRESDSLQHGACPGTIGPLRKNRAVELSFGHSRSSISVEQNRPQKT
jgi:hypothetical protein